MKILLLEYITAGGLSGQALPASLLQEGALMRDALLHDFSQLDGVEIVTTYDARVGMPAFSPQAIEIDEKSSPIQVWRELLQRCDAALIVAPETDNLLGKLARMVEQGSAKNLGSQESAVNIASDKYATFQLLETAGIQTIFTCMANVSSEGNAIRDALHGYIVKPNDGAGCEDTLYCRDKATLQAWLELNPDKQAAYILQPYQVGTPASFSMLCKHGVAWLLSCNVQKIAISNSESQRETIQYQGSIVNGLNEHRAAFSMLANRIAQALPELNGYVGVDVIVDGEDIYVVEINPRITTSYIGLHQSLNYNPAQLIMDLACNPTFELPKDLSANMIDISLNVAHE